MRREPTPTPAAPSPADPSRAGGDLGERGEPSEEDLAREVAEMRAEVISTPAADIVANHAYGLFQLAGIHLSERPPRLEEAALAIDAMGCLVEGLGERLGEAGPTLADGLAQLRMAFVQIRAAGDAAGGAVGS